MNFFLKLQKKMQNRSKKKWDKPQVDILSIKKITQGGNANKLESPTPPIGRNAS